MFYDVPLRIIIRLTIISFPVVQSSVSDANFVKVLNAVELDKCTGLQATRLKSDEQAQIIIDGNKECVEMCGWLRNSPDYQQGDCLKGTQPGCALVKDSSFRSKKWRCSLVVPGTVWGENRISVRSCVDSALQEHKRQLKLMHPSFKSSGSEPFRVHYGPPPEKYRGGAGVDPRDDSRRTKSTSPPRATRPAPAPRGKSSSPRRPTPPPEQNVPSYSVTMDPYAGHKFGTVQESTYEKGEASGVKKSASRSWSWKFRNGKKGPVIK